MLYDIWHASGFLHATMKFTVSEVFAATRPISLVVVTSKAPSYTCSLQNENNQIILLGDRLQKRFALFYRIVVCLFCSVLSCLSVCNVGVLWPNGWMDQDKTWQEGRPRPRPHCVRRVRTSPQKAHSPQFSAHVCCGQTAVWIKMPLGTEVGLGPGDIVLDGDPAPIPTKNGAQQPPHTLFGPCTVAKRLYGSRCHLVNR